MSWHILSVSFVFGEAKMLDSLPQALYTAEQVRALDRFAIEELGVEGFTLMRRAATSTFGLLLEYCPGLLRGERLQVLCGGGNNAGDGYLVATLAAMRQIPVEVIALKSPALLHGDAHKAYEVCEAQGVPVRQYQAGMPLNADIYVDALLGTGLNGPARGAIADVIAKVNASGKPVIAVDLPSGLCADTGAALGEAIVARATASFIGMKRGLLTGIGPRCCGDLHYYDLEVPYEVLNHLTPACQRLQGSELMRLLRPRSKDAHKMRHGHLLLVGGDSGMAGAPLMAAEAALYTGAGLVSLGTRAEHIGAAVARRPEVMSRALSGSDDLLAQIEGKSALVLGPGLGQSDWSKALFESAWHSELPLVLDADGLNLLSQSDYRSRQAPLIITPHPGEAARLLGSDVDAVQQDRFSAVVQLAEQYQAAVVLKGAGSLVTEVGQPCFLCAAGNPGLAVAGTGDVLSGVIGALLVQGLAPMESAALGAWLHATAGDLVVARQGELGLLATDLMPYIRKLCNRMDS